MTQLVNFSIPRMVVSGLRGGSGKTILSLCLVSLLKKKGYKVATFKKGPDYIDAGWLAKASGFACYNLDLFMMSPEQARQSFLSHSQDARIAIIEGNRGLFDGVDHEGTYSTAELAKLLKSPMIIIVDCTKATNTIAAMILGCQKMDTNVPIGGVVLNQTATSRQESLIRRAVEGRCNVPVVGAIPRLKKDPFPERHMGLTPFQEHFDVEKSLAEVAEIGEKYIDADQILKIANEAVPLRSQEVMKSASEEVTSSLPHSITPSLKIGIIRDSAFQFYYQENFEELIKRGAQLIELSPLREDRLPDIDALYIGGGFPETHAVALAENANFRNSLLASIDRGLPVYAECGGLMYLGKSLVLQNKEYPMVGALPVVFGLEQKPQAHGYSIIEIEKPNPYFSRGTVLKGHEFHYSRTLEIQENASMAFKMRRGHGIIEGRDGMCYKNVLATYTHLHAIGAPEWADGMIAAASRTRKNRA
jgi:cobyrinic acid a,c-diamide synthase